jgi:hypothetical protein
MYSDDKIIFQGSKDLGLSPVQGFKYRQRVGIELNIRECHHEQLSVNLEPVQSYYTVSLTGNIGKHCFGQINDELSMMVKRGYLKVKGLDRIVKIWDRWHLNDLQAGTTKQRIELAKYKKTGWKYNYTEARDYLDCQGLLIDRGYRYGTRWLVEPAPKGLVTWLIEWFKN